jgi:hypothetical protein
MAKKRSRSSSGGRGKSPRGLSKPISVTKTLVSSGRPPQPQPLFCCRNPGHGFGGGGASGTWYVPVGKAVAKLFPKAKPCPDEKLACLLLDDGRRVLMGPGGEFKILRSPGDPAPIIARKAINAVMLLKGWSFEQSVAWMAEQFGTPATRNSAQEYLDILVGTDTSRN